MKTSITSLSPSILVETSAARVGLAEPVVRFSLRARGDLSPLNSALGLTLPIRIGQRAQAGTLEAICLSPDEWMLHSSDLDVKSLIDACSAVYSTLPHSLVDVSGREITLVIDGPRADELLTIGCARNIDSIAVGEGRRTNFDGTLIVLWRDEPHRFRMDMWNSFADHVYHLLDIGCRELAAEAQ